jgi:energy-converting hydrogenase Eha subunit E
MKQLVLIILFFFCFLPVLKPQQSKSDTSVINKKVEISFGQSLFFVSYNKSYTAYTQSAVVIPTTSILLFSVFRPIKKLHIPVFFNVPTESKQFLINGVLINERANPTFGAGVEYKLFDINLSSNAKIEYEMAALGSSLITKTNKFVFAPIAAARFRIVQNNSFVMYLGSSYSFGINAWGLIFGTGYVF